MAPQFIVRAGDATDRRFAQAKVIICQWRRMCEAGTRPARDLAATGQAARGLLQSGPGTSVVCGMICS